VHRAYLQERRAGGPVVGALVVVEEVGVLGVEHCPGRKPPFLAVKRPVRPYKSTIQN
jgi:hypothetical protein